MDRVKQLSDRLVEIESNAAKCKDPILKDMMRKNWTFTKRQLNREVQKLHDQHDDSRV